MTWGESTGTTTDLGWGFSAPSGKNTYDGGWDTGEKADLRGSTFVPDRRANDDWQAGANDTRPSGRSCFKCGSEDHLSRECHSGGRGGRTGGNEGTGGCFNCGSTEHRSRDCTQPRKPREGGSCFNCQSTEHVSKECTLPRKPKEGEKCFDCDSTDHYSQDCPSRVPPPTVKASDEELDRLWTRVVELDKNGELDEFKEAILEYVYNNPEDNWPNVEKRLRGDNCRTYLVCEARFLPPQQEFADIAGNGDKRHEVTFIRSKFTLKKKKLLDEQGYNANFEKLADAGILRQRKRVGGKYEIPQWAREGMTQEQIYIADGVCLRCGAANHRTKSCPAVVEGQRGHGDCSKCGGTGHYFRDCPEIKPLESECRRCGKPGHKVAECPEPDTRTCNNCGEPGHKASECTEPRKITCRNCNNEGHMASECPEPRKFTGTCRNCNGEGHRSSECTEPNTRDLCRRCNQPGHRVSECTEPDNRSCRRCGEPGHLANDCPKPRTGGGGARKGCFVCGSEDHMSRECPARGGTSAYGYGGGHEEYGGYGGGTMGNTRSSVGGGW